MDKQDNKSERSFGDYLRTIRQIKGLRISDISEKSGISKSYLSRLENSKRSSPSQEILKRLAATLEVSFMSLLQISLDVTNKDIKNLKEIILEGEYTLDGIEISQEVRLLLWDIIKCFMFNEEISNVFVDKLVNKIKDLNNLL